MAREFNGSTDQLDMGNDTAIDGAFPMLVGAWVKVNILAAGCIISRLSGVTGTAGWYYTVGVSANVSFFKSGVDVYNTTVADVRPAVGVWSYHAAALANATTGTLYKVALDGTTTSELDTGSSGGFAAIGTKSRIGLASRVTDFEFFNGSIAQVSVFVGDSFSDAQVTALALGGPSAVPFTPDGYWPLNGASLTDDSPNNFDATATGTTVVGDPPIPSPVTNQSLVPRHGVGMGRW
jgi:hypothetical protein